MCNIRKIGPVLLGTLLLTVGCSANSDKLMSGASENMNNVASYTLVANTTMTTEIEGQAAVTVNSTYETKGTMTPETSISMTNTTTLEAGNVSEEEESVSYVVQTTDGICYYEKQGDNWYKITVDGMDMLGDMVKQPNKVLKNFMQYVDQYKMGSTEVMVDDKPCYEVQAVVPEENFSAVLNEINNIQDLGLNEEAMEMMAAKQQEFGGLVISFYIDKESKMLVKQTMDLSGMMKIGLQEAFASQGSESVVDNVGCTMQIMYQDINSTEAVEIPEEVNNAEEIQ